MQKFEEWWDNVHKPYLYLDTDWKEAMEDAYKAGYNQRNKEIEEHYRKVMENEKSTEIGVPMSPVGDLDYSR